MSRWAALLRAVNVGGRPVPMAALRTMAGEVGLRDARTLLASGNLVFEHDGAPDMLETLIEEAIARAFGLKSEVLVRGAAELDAVIAANPFPDAARERPARLVVHFHRDPLLTDYAEALASDNPGDEAIAARGRALYVDYADGIGTSKLDRVMKLARFRRLNTARNWNTVLKLRAALG